MVSECCLIHMHQQAKDCEPALVPWFHHLCRSPPCPGGERKTKLRTKKSGQAWDSVLKKEGGEFESCLGLFLKASLTIRNHKLMKAKLFTALQGEREAPEKAAAAKWIHQTHKLEE